MSNKLSANIGVTGVTLVFILCLYHPTGDEDVITCIQHGEHQCRKQNWGGPMRPKEDEAIYAKSGDLNVNPPSALRRTPDPRAVLAASGRWEWRRKDSIHSDWWELIRWPGFICSAYCTCFLNYKGTCSLELTFIPPYDTLKQDFTLNDEIILFKWWTWRINLAFVAPWLPSKASQKWKPILHHHDHCFFLQSYFKYSY